MRILAIRGRNLASLAGDFDIDFAAEPLAGSGIFAITGPTGAGKSTLLDAVCLALFDEIPRLRAAPARGQLGVGDDKAIKPGDTRAILRHGTAEAYAEVDFAMPDGASYRARWAVRRARGKADGRLQAPDHSFLRIDTNERMGGTRGETKAAIAAVIGLSAEQFGRAVLLAQGDFEAFIRSDADDRAHLLERLTGSEIYTTLGRRAFEKARGLKEAIDALGRRIAELNGLDDTRRQAAEAALAEAEAAQQAAGERLETLRTARRWEDRAGELARATDGARYDHATATALSHEAEPRRAALAQDRRALALAPDWAELDKAARREARSLREVADVAADLARATTAEQAARDAEATAQAACDAAGAEAAALAPDLAAARELDGRLGEAARMLAGARAERDQGQQRGTAAAGAETAAAGAWSDAQRAHAAARDWLDTHQPLERLAQREDELAAALFDHARIAAALAARHGERPRCAAARQAAQQACDTAAQALAEAAAHQQAAQEDLARAEAALPLPHVHQALAERRDSLGRIDVLLATDQAAREALMTAEQALQAISRALAAREDDQDTLAARQADLAGRRPALAMQVVDAARELQLLQSAASDAAETLRATLEEGEPCPVCGATAHRLNLFEGKLGEHLRAREQAGKALEEQLDALDRAVLDCAAQGRALADTLTRLRHDRIEQARRLEPAVHRARAARETLLAHAGALGLPSDALPEALDEHRRRADQDLAAIHAARATADAARQAEQQARAGHDAARAAQAAARDTLAVCHQALDDLDRAIAAHAGEAARIADTLDRHCGPAADWRGLPDASAWLADQAGTWRDRHAEVGRLSVALPSLQAAHAGAATDLRNAVQGLAQLDARLHAAAQAHADLAATRAALLGGDTVAGVERRLAQARQRAADTQHLAVQQREIRAQARIALAAGEAAAGNAAQTAHADHAARAEAFAQALHQAGLAAADVVRVAVAGPGGIEVQARALADLDDAVRTTQAILAQREGDMARHHAAQAPDVLGEALLIAVAQATDALETAIQARTDADYTLRQDDAVRTRTAQLRAELERRNQDAAVWLALDDLIGDATGAKFRKFAQGLTLDCLLDHANTRLAELKPRYTLERAGGGDMLIQVIDNDMGGDVRGLHNLSGGERFLVSLALALGLAEMSTAGGVKIESLFIDEGFGALDPASLGQAVALLEHLHASGRRVGVISHIEELKERIPVKIEVSPTGRGTSRVTVVAG
jgi:DNA repair protein SbcC/Rad50